VAVWDIRVKSKPIMQSQPNLKNHNLPIYCIENVFDGRRDLVMSISNEGKLSVWNPEGLSDAELTETLNFRQDKAVNQKGEKEYEDVPLSPMASCIFSAGGAKDAKIYIATMDKLIQAYSVNEILTKLENKTTARLNGHEAPINVIAVNNQEQSTTFGCVLTGSFDFGICLWKPSSSSEPVATYEIHDDYITGLDWNPNHPAMFVSSDCSGTIALWNLLEEKDYPVYTIRTDPISNAKWHPDGVKLIVATLNGNVELWEIKKRFTKFTDD
jgi:WD40 repeat protein